MSSTGHLLLVQRFFGFGDDDFGKSFAVLIQFGAILALLSIYAVRLWQLLLGMFNDPAARRFIIGVLIAFLPAAVVGATADKFIKEVLFNPWIVCCLADRRRRDLVLGRSARSQAALSATRRIHAADVSHHRHRAVRFDDPRRVALRRHHRGGDAARRRPARGRRILVLARDADHGRRVRLRSLQGPRPFEPQQSAARRHRLRRLVHLPHGSW